MNVLVTGANGFVGRHVVASLLSAGHSVSGVVRREFDGFDPDCHVIDEDGSSFQELVVGKDAVVHTAGVAHRTYGSVEELRSAFHMGNVEQTRLLCDAVSRAGVEVLIHISSIAAAGRPGSFGNGVVLSEDVETGMYNDYGQSKRDAEAFVSQLADVGKVGINLRPALIYGPGARGNWPKLLSLARKPFPLPFGSVDNQRSYLGVENLTGLIQTILESELSVSLSGNYHVADDELVSLREIVGALRAKLGRSPGLMPFPPAFLAFCLKALGREGMAEGLFGDLILDTSKVKKTFAWKPIWTTLDGMARSL
ncbi:MAG: hypothetical protein CMO55_20285 [Verrucomicrobiales bacterium]|nr:hypothetical protein [Verrucomicrobiales bacterium]